MISDKLLKLCQGSETVTSVLAKDPLSTSPGEVVAKLFKEHVPEETKGIAEKMRILACGTRDSKNWPKKEDLDRAVLCGKFGDTRPSDLFLQIYYDVLQTVDEHPMAGVVSPPLLGSRGVVPLTILSTNPDIMQHYHDCIINAQTEVFLATNYWQVSKASAKVIEGIRELSRRVVARGDGTKVVFKLMYDRGSPKQALENHLLVSEEEWQSDQVKLPPRSELPGLEFEVVNFHRPLLGTFHSKYMVVDRRIALLNSNNIQDMPNMEMMVHMEGPIVDSFYDVCLLSWDRKLIPPLPQLCHPAAQRTDPYKFGMDHSLISCKELLQPGVMSDKRVEEIKTNGDDASSTDSLEKARDTDAADVALTDRFHFQHRIMTDGSKPLCPKDGGYQCHVVHKPHGEVPMALVNRRPYGTPGHCDTWNPQDVAWLAGMKYAEKKAFIQTPDFNASPMIDATLAAVRRGVECTLYICVGYNDAGEALPFQGGTNEEVVKKMYAELKDEEKQFLKVFWYTAVDQTRPLNASLKKRNCHVKLMIVDEKVGIQGNGNQDAQSWYHSQETNVMIDSALVCTEWLAGIRETQSTHLYGALQKDGVWRDKDGTPLPDSTGITSGPMGLIKGIQGSIARVRGTGGF